MLLEKLKSKLLEERKLRSNKVAVLQFVIGQAQTYNKTKDDEVINTIKKTISNNNEVISLSKNEAEKLRLSEENTLLKQFLPQYLSIEELQLQIEKSGIEKNVSSMKKFLDYFSQNNLVVDKGMLSNELKKASSGSGS